MAVTAKLTAQAVFMVEPEIKAAVEAEANAREVAAATVWREIVLAGITAREESA